MIIGLRLSYLIPRNQIDLLLN